MSYSNIPVPDPSLITEREIAKAKTDLRRETDLQLATLREWIDGRYAVMEHVTGEKFIGVGLRFDAVAMRFTERDRQVEQKWCDNKEAVSAALLAQKDDTLAKHDSAQASRDKMESYFAKQTDQTQQLLREMQRSSDEKINDLKSRLDKGEGTVKGGADSRTEYRLNIGSIVGIVGGAVGLLALLWSIGQGLQIGSNARRLDTITESSRGIPSGYSLVPTPPPSR